MLAWHHCGCFHRFSTFDTDLRDIIAPIFRLHCHNNDHNVVRSSHFHQEEYMGIHWDTYSGIFRHTLFPHTPLIQDFTSSSRHFTPCLRQYPLHLSDTIAPIFRSHCQLTFSPLRTSFSCVGTFDVWRLGVSDQPVSLRNDFCDHFGSSDSQNGSSLHSIYQEYMGIHRNDYDGISRRDLFPHTPAIQMHLCTINRALVFCQHYNNQQEESRTDLTRAQPIKAGQPLLMTDPTSEVNTL